MHLKTLKIKQLDFEYEESPVWELEIVICFDHLTTWNSTQ